MWQHSSLCLLLLLQLQKGHLTIAEVPPGLSELDPLRILRADKTKIHYARQPVSNRNGHIASTVTHAQKAAAENARTRRMVELPDFLLDPINQTMFDAEVPNALHPDFIYEPDDTDTNLFKVYINEDLHDAGLKDTHADNLLTTIWGYGSEHEVATWPGKTFEVQRNQHVKIHWFNKVNSDCMAENGWLSIVRPLHEI